MNENPKTHPAAALLASPAPASSKAPKAVIYARISTEKGDTSLSIPEQIRCCEAIAVKYGYEVIETCAEEESGGKWGEGIPEAKGDTKAVERYKGDIYRHQFGRVIKYIREEKVSAVLVWRKQRLARPLGAYHAGWLVDFFRSNNVKIITNDETIDYSNVATIIMSLIQDTMLREEIEANRKASMNTRATIKRNGGITGRVHYGYKALGKQVIMVDTDRSKAVQTMFAMYADGDSFMSIVRWLSEHGYKTQCRTAVWRDGSIRAIISSPAYIGKFRDNNGELKPSPVYPAIVADNLWYRANARLAERQSVPPRAGDRNSPFSHFEICHSCGRFMQITTSRKERYVKGVRCHHYVKAVECRNPDCKQCSKKFRIDEFEKVWAYIKDNRSTTFYLFFTPPDSGRQRDTIDFIGTAEERLSDLIERKDELVSTEGIPVADLPKLLSVLNSKIEVEQNKLAELRRELDTFIPADDTMLLRWVVKHLRVSIDGITVVFRNGQEWSIRYKIDKSNHSKKSLIPLAADEIEQIPLTTLEWAKNAMGYRPFSL